MIDEQYKNHRIFKELSTYEEFYKSLSYSIMDFITHGTTGNFDTYMYSSIQGTLESIKLILETGRINDAYALLRKYYDSVMINVYAMLFLSDKNNILTDDFFIKNQITSWIQGKETLPKFGMLKQYIQRSEDLKAVNGLFNQDNRYTEIRERCNGNTHYNDFNHVLLNDNEIYNDKRIDTLNEFSSDALNIFLLHFIYMFTINGHYIASSDYVDYLDAGRTPPENSENWVAPFIQEIFDSVVKPARPDLAEELKNTVGMELN